MPRGIIMSISGREAVILTKDSDFVKVVLPKGDYDLGQEIDAVTAKNSLMGKLLMSGGRRLAAAAAVLLIAIVLPMAATTVYMNNTVYAYVTLDINPSTEFSVNGRERIIMAQPLNEEGALLLKSENLKGREIEYGIEYFVRKACELGYADPGEEGAVIATTVMEKEESTELEQKISTALVKTIESNKLNVETGVLSANKEIRKEAKNAGVSTGKYLIALQATEDQLEVDIEDVKNSSITSVINKAGGDLGSILQRARKTGDELTRVFENNREKLESSKGRGKDDGKGNDNSSNDRGNRNSDNSSNEGGRGGNSDNARENIRNNNSNNGSNGRSNNGNTGETGEKEGRVDRDSREENNNDKGNDNKNNNDKDNDSRNNNDKDNDNKNNNDKDNNSWNNNDKDNGNRNNNDKGNDNKNNNGRDNNNREENDRDNNNRSNSGRDSNNRDNNGNNDERVKDNDRNENRRAGVIEDIIMHLFD